jgi:hypothetical protein
MKELNLKALLETITLISGLATIVIIIVATIV